MPPPRTRGHYEYFIMRDPEWMLNVERERNVQEFAALLEQLGQRLREAGEVTISGHKIAPPKQCWTVVRYERMPRGELSLKIELQWEREGIRTEEGPSDIDIE